MKILPIDQIWANEIRYCRQNEKLTAREVSEMTGIPEATIFNYEFGHTVPKSTNRDKLNDLFNINMSELTNRLAKNGLDKALAMRPVKTNKNAKPMGVKPPLYTKTVKKREEKENKNTVEEQMVKRFSIMNEITSLLNDEVAKPLITADQMDQLSVVMNMPFDVLNIKFNHIKKQVDSIRNYEPNQFDFFSFSKDPEKEYVIAHISKTSNGHYGIIYFDFHNGEFRVSNTLINKNEIRFAGKKFKETDFKTIYNAQLRSQRETYKFSYSPK